MIKAPCEYAKFLALQERLLAKVINSNGNVNFLLLTSHDPPVYTLGRQEHTNLITLQKQLFPISVYAINRGGQTTWHGPGQTCIYPLINLKKAEIYENSGSLLGSYVNKLQQILVDSIKHVSADELSDNNIACKESGVWVKDQKVGFVGFGVSRWCTSHGASLNWHPQTISSFKRIIPCGVVNMPIGHISMKNSFDIEQCLLNSFKRIMPNHFEYIESGFNSSAII